MKNTNPSKRYLLKRKRFGWEWVPTTWQGMLIIVVFTLPVLWEAFTLPEDPRGARLLEFLVVSLVSVSLMLIIIARVSPPPRWRWGKKDSDNTKEDF